MIKTITNRKEKIVFAVAFICGMFLIIPFKIKPIIAISMLLFLFFKSKNINFKEVLVLNLLFISYCFSLFYCFDTKTGLDYLVRVLPLFSIPLCYAFLENKIQLKFNTIFYNTFILSSVLYVLLIFLYMAQIGYFVGDKDLYVSYSFLTYQFWGLNDHPIYTSLALGLSIILLIEHNFKNKFFNIIFFIILTIGILFLARKAVIISLFFSLILISILKKTNKQIRFILITFGLLFLISLLFREIRDRYFELFFLNNIVENRHTSTGIRNIVWSNSIELIKQFPFFGYSVGDIQNVLSNQLSNEGFVELAKKNTNTHNQYLQTILTSGFVGLGCFIVSIYYAFRKLINNKKYLEICLLLFFLLNFFTESFLYRQNGILLYSLFISIGVISLPIMEKSKKKVLIIGSFPGPTKGISLSNLIVYNGLKGKGWQVEKINTERTNEVDVELGKFSMSKLKFLLSYFECYKILSANKIYITIGITFLGVVKYTPFIFFSRILRKELIVHVHSNHLKTQYDELTGFKKKIFYFLLSSFDKGIVLSESLRQNLTPFIKEENIFDVYNFYEDKLISNEDKLVQDKNYHEIRLIYLSNLLYDKGINNLLEAMQLLNNDGISLKLKIAGTKVQSNNVDSLISKLPNTEYLGVVLEKQKSDLLTWGNVFCLPTFFSMEGQPISIIEAMALNNLILTTKHAGIPDLCKDEHAVFCEMNNSIDLYLKLKFIYQNWNDLKKKAATNGLYARTNFTEKIFVDNIEKVIIGNK